MDELTTLVLPSEGPVVFVLPETLSPDEVNRAAETLREAYPDGRLILLFPHGTEQAQIDRVAIGAAVLAERERCNLICTNVEPSDPETMRRRIWDRIKSGEAP